MSSISRNPVTTVEATVTSKGHATPEPKLFLTAN